MKKIVPFSLFEDNSFGFKGFKSHIEDETLDNNNFRKVLYTGNHLQLVLMSLNIGEEIGEEIHHDNDQFFRVEGGKGKCIIDGTEYKIKDGDSIIVPAGAKHNIINTSKKKELKIYTIYAPPHHKDGIIRSTKEDAKDNPEKYDGKPTEEDKQISKPESEKKEETKKEETPKTDKKEETEDKKDKKEEKPETDKKEEKEEKEEKEDKKEDKKEEKPETDKKEEKEEKEDKKEEKEDKKEDKKNESIKSFTSF